MKSLETRISDLEAVVAAVDAPQRAEIHIYRLGSLTLDPVEPVDWLADGPMIRVHIPHNGREPL